MGCAEVSGKLDILFGKRMEEVLRTCNHSLQIPPFDQSLLGCHEALLLPQVPVVPCPLAQLVLTPVCVTISRITNVAIYVMLAQTACVH